MYADLHGDRQATSGGCSSDHLAHQLRLGEEVSTISFSHGPPGVCSRGGNDGGGSGGGGGVGETTQYLKKYGGIHVCFSLLGNL